MKYLKASVIFLLFVMVVGCNSKDRKTTDKEFAFESQNFAGEEISDKIFSKYDVTVVNVWGTYCPPCLAEMPLLGEVDRNLPENINMIGICIDTYMEDTVEQNNLDLAKEILADSNCAYENIQNSDSLIELLKDIKGVPTTFFIDADGNFYAEPIIGAIIDEQSFRNFLEHLEPYIDPKDWLGE